MTPQEREELLQRLAAGPVLLAELLRPLTDKEMRYRPGQDQWSAKEVVGHLLDIETRVQQRRFRLIVEEDTPTFPATDHIGWVKEGNYQEQDFRRKLEAWRQARAETIAFLRGLPAEAWDRQGMHPRLGPTSFGATVKRLANHDVIHADQIRVSLEQMRRG